MKKLIILTIMIFFSTIWISQTDNFNITSIFTSSTGTIKANGCIQLYTGNNGKLNLKFTLENTLITDVELTLLKEEFHYSLCEGYNKVSNTNILVILSYVDDNWIYSFIENNELIITVNSIYEDI